MLGKLMLKPRPRPLRQGDLLELKSLDVISFIELPAASRLRAKQKPVKKRQTGINSEVGTP